MSTNRMCARFAAWINHFQFIVTKFNEWRAGKIKVKDENPILWLIKFVEIVGMFTDNWNYLNRITIWKYPNMKVGAWVMWMSAACALCSLYLQMMNTIYEAYHASKKEASLQ